jgi:signal transduction histidine kinase
MFRRFAKRMARRDRSEYHESLRRSDGRQYRQSQPTEKYSGLQTDQGAALLPTTRRHVLNIRRIVGGTLVLVCVVVNSLAVIHVAREHELIEETIEATTSEHGVAWAELCGVQMRAGATSALQGVVDAIGRSESVRLAMVVDESGRVVAATDRQRIGELRQVDHEETNDEMSSDEPQVEELHPEPTGFFHELGHTFQFHFPIRTEADRLGTLVVQVNTAWGNQQAKTLAVKGLLLVFSLTCLVALAAVALDWRLRKAVKALIAATQAIAKGERTPDVHVGTGDYLDVLGESVKRMAVSLQDTEERVTHWHRELESTIANRTAQLEESQQLLAEREKMAALGLMAAGIVHEIGNPLTAMSAIVQRIERKADARFTEQCRTLSQQIERISKIVNDMRHVARPVSSNGSSTNVNETLRVAVKVAQYDPRATAIEIVPHLSAAVPRIPGDADRWQQVFMNLIINALDAMPRGGRLLVSTSTVDGHVAIAFRDSGDGMNAEQLRQLYHPFYSTKANDGMGLGLSVCHSIVRSYGGEIVVESEVGRGTEFRITIAPYKTRLHTERSTTQAGRDQDSSAASGRDRSLPRGELKA